MHVIIPFAAPHPEVCELALQGLQLPGLQALLAGMRASDHIAGTADAYSLPHEVVLARLHGVSGSDGTFAWAAWELQQQGAAGTGPCAWFTPCHWQAQVSGFTLGNPHRLGVDASEARALTDSLAPLLEADGLRLSLLPTGRWLVQGELLRDLRCATPERVVGQSVQDWLVQGPGALALTRLQSEIQMLLYTHPVNDTRLTLGRKPVNALWLHGAGTLHDSAPPATTGAIEVWDALRDSALDQDWPAWRRTWAELDAGAITTLHQRLRRGEPVTFTLCGWQHARSYRAHPRPWWQRWARPAAPSAVNELKSL